MKEGIMYLALFVGLYVITGLIVRRSCNIKLPFSKDFTNVIKGLAIAVVIYSHLGNLFNIRYLTPLGGIGVALFLIASGYGINESWKKNGPEYFWKKRLISVYIPYLIIELAAAPIRGGYQDISEFLMDITSIRSSYYLGWYIPFILGCYALFYFTTRYIKRYRFVIWGAIGTAFVFIASQLQARQAFSFLVGVILSENMDLDRWQYVKRNSWKIALMLISIALAALTIKQFPVIRNQPLPITNIIEILIAELGALGIILLIYCSRNLVTYIPFGLLGTISYELYLIHGYTLWIVDLTFWNSIIFIFLTLTVAFSIHCVMHKLQSALIRSIK